MSTITVSNPERVDEAVQQFKEKASTVSTQYELALLERDLWRQVREFVAGAAAGRKQRWWDENLGGRNLASFRSALLTRGDSVQALWQYIDAKQLTLSGAFRLMKLADQGIKNLDQLLAEYLAMSETVSRNGQVYRRRQRGSTKQVPGTEHVVNPRAQSVSEKSTSEEPAANLDDWRAARKAIETTIENLVDGLAEPKKTRLCQEFKMEVGLLIESMSSRIYRERNSSTEKLRYRDLIEACEALDVKPPGRGRPVDQKIKTEAWRKYRKFARHYHPDLRGGDQSYRHLLERVINAWNVISAWNGTDSAVARTTSEQREGE